MALFGARSKEKLSEDIDMEETKLRSFELAQEVEELADKLREKARELREAEEEDARRRAKYRQSLEERDRPRTVE